ncbi:uncharacterized protein LOC107605703 [Arachis ipaensis]|uniref:uncharacterized protein LOC107605703 n=1 Tax=Arachis ipaensis TaxID=130454 RepID=UPI0007AFA2A4|nr:uncharacterized protein LOC107605703 [Arachis ipaensis]
MKAKLSSLQVDMTVSSLLYIAATASAAALTMLIYKGRRKSLLQAPHKGDFSTVGPQSEPEPECKPCGKILFFSRIGTSKALAQHLRYMLASNGVTLELVDTVDYEPEDLPKENLVLVIASTAEHWNRSPAPEDFAEWLKEKARNFEGEVFVVKACTFSAFGVVGRVSEDGKNLMAKAANHIRDLGHATQLNPDFDFDNWWQRAVGVLKGAVLEDTVAVGKCHQSEPERFYVFVENVEDVGSSTTFTHKMLTVTEADLMKNGCVDLEEAGPVTPLAKGIKIDSSLSNSSLSKSLEFCSVGGVLYFVPGRLMGGIPKDYGVIMDLHYPKKFWCLKYDGSTWIWKLLGNTFISRNRALVVPYDGKLLIFGGGWIEIYDPKSDYWDRREVPYNAFIQGSMDPESYFLWEDKSTKHHKTLIFLYRFSRLGGRSIVSYDVEANRWKPIECQFPKIRRNVLCPTTLVLLGSSDYLLVVEELASNWYVYDLSRRMVMADLHIDGLDDTWRVLHVFCCHHNQKEKESLIYMFMQQNESGLHDLVHYARVKLKTGGLFSVKVESKGYFKAGPYTKLYMFAVGDEDIEGKNAA